MKMLVIRGLPGSGKTTLAKKLAALLENSFCFEADMFFETDGEYKFDAEKLPLAHSWCQERTEIALKNNCDVIVSNTFSRFWEMEPYLEMAERYECDLFVIETRGKWPSVHNVPQHSIEKMKERWEPFKHSYVVDGFFPIIVRYSETNEEVLVKSPAELKRGARFFVLKTQYIPVLYS